ncbi:PEP-CTERM sorting domain-containing protein [Gloeocapsa sp. PCC 73106]|uniref:PEP-CTERM sorting domain-containing protein n=1 Tax=Gloeocapsa sp. PCC 73106 TaxID=102232 RepID=UPI0002ACEC28|nr:PEP-CTERM sorting domain-containing protein [Gloeocapsa sp. PCC 73106]ELR97762.1 hypothetical protein GLO73106DRAFT_00015770 [Gloeocapsa sp. PCC 73106]
MSHYLVRTTAIALTASIGIAIPTVSQAVTYGFSWTGQIAGLQIRGTFGYDENASYTGGIVRTDDLDFLSVSFYDSEGSLLRSYPNNHLDPGVNFNFDTQTETILQEGLFDGPEGITIGGENYDIESENIINGEEPQSGLTFWSDPPRSSSPHVHFSDWLDDFGLPLAFSNHADVAFPFRTTQQLIDTGRTNPIFVPPQGTPATPLDQVGEFAQAFPIAEPIPEPLTILGTGLALASLPVLKKARHSKN